MTSSETKITLYKQAKAGLKSLFVQMAQVALGLIVMLVATGGNPPGWMVSASFILGVGFVALSEKKRQEKLKSEIQIIENNNDILTLKKGVKVWNLRRRLGFHKRANLYRANLKGANLKGANLKGVYLEGADLESANLRGACLRSANLEGAILNVANLEGASLESAYLVRAYLEDANLEGAILENADVEKAQFGNNLGINEELRQDLIKRGAKFVDSPEDPVAANTPVHR